jgi:PKD repeat protein
MFDPAAMFGLMKPYRDVSKITCSKTPYRIRPAAGRLRLGARLIATCSVTFGLVAAPALAVSPTPSATTQALSQAGLPAALASPYGEVSRFGGFDSTGSTPGKFVFPVGFAVDRSDPSTSDGNAVYVLDRTLVHRAEEEEGKLDYRLQKLSSTGAVLGSVTLPVQTFLTEGPEAFAAAHPLISLAVDPVNQRVYALVQSVVGSVPVADELVAWSTVPNAGKELVKAPGYAEDGVTHAGLVAEVLGSELSKDLYAPEGISVDPKNHDVVIEAQNGVSGTTGGPTILQRVITTEGAGKLGESWIADSTTSPSEEPSDGLFTASDGESFGLDLFVGRGEISRLASVKRDFAKPEPTLIAEDKSGGKNKDQAPTLDNELTVNYRESHTEGGTLGLALEAYTAGTPITQLTNNLYAARYGQWMNAEVLPDGQSRVPPWSEAFGLNTFWTQDIFPNKEIASEGIRLFEADGKAVTTIGGQAVGQACNLDSGRLALAAGANGSVFALGQPNSNNGNSDDEVIEFAPGGAGKCPTPSGEVEVNGAPTLSATVTQGKPVKFSALSIGPILTGGARATPYSFEWYFEGTAVPASKTYAPVSKIEAPAYKWPTPEAEHTYNKAGTYEANVRMTGDYGTSVFPVTVKVDSTEPAVAKFAAPASIVAKQPATFDAKESKATPESQIAIYRWEFGDGSSPENTPSAQKSHTFAAAGEYKVKLKITDESGETAETEQSVIVAASKEGPKPPEETSTPPGTQTTSTIPAQATSLIPAVSIPPKPVRPLTEAQKLAKAIKACKKIKSKKKRASCEKQAKKKYAKKVKKKSAKKK